MVQIHSQTDNIVKCPGWRKQGIYDKEHTTNTLLRLLLPCLHLPKRRPIVHSESIQILSPDWWSVAVMFLLLEVCLISTRLQEQSWLFQTSSIQDLWRPLYSWKHLNAAEMFFVAFPRSVPQHSPVTELCRQLFGCCSNTHCQLYDLIQTGLQTVC